MKSWLVVLIGFLIAGVGFVVDRGLKYIAITKFSASSREFLIIGNLLKFKLTYNPGIAFGIMIPSLLIGILYIGILCLLVWLMVRWCQQRDGYKVFATLMIIAGAASNLLDRARLGYVVDYLDLHYYAVFNIADVMIVVGTCVLALLFYFNQRK